ncbi:MAG: GAF domain-containing SpoIIE family protein phosphatase [Verrucomicrobiota bacterium]|nr:GAF domain-containing SpoIIE family protein phosphatase [Verrucomicrobiota bacterium]
MNTDDFQYQEWVYCQMGGETSNIPKVLASLEEYCHKRAAPRKTVECLLETVRTQLDQAFEDEPRKTWRIGWCWHEQELLVTVETARVPRLKPNNLTKTPIEFHFQMGYAATVVSEANTIIASMTEDLSTSYESLSALFHYAEELATAHSFREFVTSALQRLVKLVDGSEAFVRIARHDDNLELRYYATGVAAHLTHSIHIQDAFVEGIVFKHREERTVEDCSQLRMQDPLFSLHGSAFVCPIFFQEKTLGVLTLLRSREGPYFTAGQISLIKVVADFLGIAYINARLQKQRHNQQRARRDLEIAAQIQRSLLPEKFPDTRRFRIYGTCQNAQEVGGDYFDVLPVGDKGVLLVIADVMGKGVPAALLAMIFRTVVHSHMDLATTPEKLLTEVNRKVSQDIAQLNMFITAQVAYLSYDDMSLTLSNAGHCPLIILRQDGDSGADFHATEGLPLGLTLESEYKSEKVFLKEWDKILMITDGIFEAENPRGDMLGMRGVAEHASELWHGPGDKFCADFLEGVKNFTNGADATDDRTLIAVEVL